MESLDIIRGPYTMEGIQEFHKLAASGYSDEVYQYILKMQRQYPFTVNDPRRHEVYLYLFGGLARAGDPRGHIQLAQEKLRVANLEYKYGNRQAMGSELDVADRYLSSASVVATGEMLDHVKKLQFEVRKLQNSPTTFHVVTSAFLATSSFMGTWQRDGLENAIRRREDCLKNKPAVDQDPTLRLPYSLFGCMAY